MVAWVEEPVKPSVPVQTIVGVAMPPYVVAFHVRGRFVRGVPLSKHDPLSGVWKAEVVVVVACGELVETVAGKVAEQESVADCCVVLAVTVACLRPAVLYVFCILVPVPLSPSVPLHESTGVPERVVKTDPHMTLCWMVSPVRKKLVNTEQ